MRWPATMPGSSSNVEPRHLADAHLAPDEAPQVRSRGAQRVAASLGDRIAATPSAVVAPSVE